MTYYMIDENISEQEARDEFERKKGILTRKVPNLLPNTALYNLGDMHS